MFRNRIIFTGIIVGVFSIIAFLSSGVARMAEPVLETYNRNNLIRLHVVAASNQPEDQALKLKVRDNIIKATEPLLLKVENPSEAEAILRRNIPLLKKVASDTIEENGCNMSVKVSLERFLFPEVAYPFGVLPAGEYKGLKIILGRGEGRNWWCVLYPPLCLLEPDAPTFRVTVSKAPPVEYKLAFLEELIKQKDLSLDDFWKGWSKFFGIL